ncbi:hypothetical protein K469DRAFT_702648 [Zopfia rhizophila CBS 207.26]|uniref:DUF7730 domain-containing protein n=1 Tax=Zopfia rhizophila CBS 207.26 TaxID=1314779 RepID=A0A6A6EAW5_9PEZI|nr:hypothetical protein K469DRAFT_702648 [Zopfia rhizophila CBS 207.26]
MSYYTLYHHPTTTVVHQPTPPTHIHPNNPFKLRARGASLTTNNRPTAPSERVTVSKSGGMSHQLQSPLFRLPAELRNQVYGYLLCPDALSIQKQIQKSKKKDMSVAGYNVTSTPTTIFPQILSTCKRIHEEAEAILYGLHTFHAHPSLLTSLPYLTTSAHPVLYKTVTSKIQRWSLSLRLDIDPRFTLEQATAAFSGAEYLEIHVWQAQFEACDYSVLKLFTGVRGVKIARVGGSVDRELAEWLEGLMMLPERRGVREEMRVCDCCPGFEGRSEILCGRCYKKVQWVGGEWDVWKFGGR